MQTQNTHTHVTSHRHSMYDKYVEKRRKKSCLFLFFFVFFSVVMYSFSDIHFFLVIILFVLLLCCCRFIIFILISFRFHSFSLFSNTTATRRQNSFHYPEPKALNKTFPRYFFCCLFLSVYYDFVQSYHDEHSGSLTRPCHCGSQFLRVCSHELLASLGFYRQHIRLNIFDVIN